MPAGLQTIKKVLFAAIFLKPDFCWMRMAYPTCTTVHNFLRRFFCIIASGALGTSVVRAQLFEKTNYPQNYFVWPIDANIGLAANFGELRPNHYHMGLDCRSDQTVNRPVFAAAAGYIAKVKIEPFGFGRALYVNHPNGMTTLYAHLNNFYPALENYVKQQQYNLKSWNIFIDIPARLFEVAKGEEIAKSGNTGGSQGPHLHFEVRDTKTDKVINPLLLGFPIQDNIAPDILRLAVYDRRLSTYEQSPKIYALKKINGVYTPITGNITVNTNKVSFAITAWDRYTGSSNQNGIYEATLFDNDAAVCGFRLNNIGYDETRYLNANVDYKTRSGGGPWLQHLSKLPGYNANVYAGSNINGIINLETGAARSIKILVSDANENSSNLVFTIQTNGSIINSIATPTLENKMFYPGFVNVFENENVQFYLPENALYDAFRFQFKETPSATGNSIFQLHTATVPVHTYFNIGVKGNFALADTGKIVMRRTWGAKTDFKKAVLRNGYYTAAFREFGNYQLLADNLPPVIVSRNLVSGMNTSKLNAIIFTVTDNSEDLERFVAYLNGKWLRFSNDKARNFVYEFDENCPPGTHELQVTAYDLVGNSSTKIYQFTR